jgi:hypothetical protein
MGVGPALEHGQVGLAELADKWAGRQQLMDQVLDTALVGGGSLGEPIGGPHAAVQRRPGRIRQLERVQPGRVDQRQPGQGIGVDPVGLGVPRQHPPQVVGFGRADPVHDVAAGREEHRDRQPRRPGRLHHHLQAGARRVSARAACSTCSRLSRVGIALRRQTRRPSPASTRTVWALVIPRSIPTSRRSSIRLPPWPWWPAGRPLRRGGALRPRSQGRCVRRRHPLMCCNRPQPSRVGPLPSSGASVAGQGR